MGRSGRRNRNTQFDSPTTWYGTSDGRSFQNSIHPANRIRLRCGNEVWSPVPASTIHQTQIRARTPYPQPLSPDGETVPMDTTNIQPGNDQNTRGPNGNSSGEGCSSRSLKISPALILRSHCPSDIQRSEGSMTCDGSQSSSSPMHTDGEGEGVRSPAVEDKPRSERRPSSLVSRMDNEGHVWSGSSY